MGRAHWVQLGVLLMARGAGSKDGFSGPLGPQEKDFPPRFHGVLSPGVLAPPRAGFGTSKGSGAVLFAFPKCRQQARQRGKRCGNSQLVVPGFWCKTRGFQDSEQGRSPPPAAFCPDREREACACLATCEGCDLASVLSGAERGAAGSQPADTDTAAGMHAGCSVGPLLALRAVAQDRASARLSLLHAKYAGSLQDPAAFCTALLQKGSLWVEEDDLRQQLRVAGLRSSRVSAAGKLQMHLAVKALNFGMLPVFKISLALDRPQDCAGFNVSICSAAGFAINFAKVSPGHGNGKREPRCCGTAPLRPAGEELGDVPGVDKVHGKYFIPRWRLSLCPASVPTAPQPCSHKFGAQIKEQTEQERAQQPVPAPRAGACPFLLPVHARGTAVHIPLSPACSAPRLLLIHPITKSLWLAPSTVSSSSPHGIPSPALPEHGRAEEPRGQIVHGRDRTCSLRDSGLRAGGFPFFPSRQTDSADV
ncbi:hypothetical protein Anapl_16282 [Anas platyrhynchos]|uniref:Uncharacterized protein n=1 Tax=Anas platyrhynchos TaxID=8839 RepID=R0KWH6_ANAPL|nr:hypothetical protein Anapl_16282 [Anas platyrhynchos]